MVATWRLAVGGGAVLLGVGWILAPTRMSRLQTRVMYLGYVDYDFDQTDSERLAGRIAGALLAALGVVLMLGMQL